MTITTTKTVKQEATLNNTQQMKLGPLQKKWVKSLKENPDRQLKDRLGVRSGDGYKACCLGEVAMILGICTFDADGFMKIGSEYYDLTGHYHKMGLRDECGEIADDPYNSLACLNDDRDHTWPEIAYLIESAPELFFTKSV
jgi:hypothetical protein